MGMDWVGLVCEFCAEERTNRSGSRASEWEASPPTLHTPPPTLCTRLVYDQKQAVQVRVFSAGVDDPLFASWYPELKEEGTLQHRSSGDGAGGEDVDVQRFKVRGLVYDSCVWKDGCSIEMGRPLVS